MMALLVVTTLGGGAVLSRSLNAGILQSVWISLLCLLVCIVFMLLMTALVSFGTFSDKLRYTGTLLAPDGVHCSTPEGLSRIEWSHLIGIVFRNGDIFFLIRGGNTWYVPRSSFADISHARNFYEAAVAAKSGDVSRLQTAPHPVSGGGEGDTPGWDTIPAEFEHVEHHRMHPAPQPVPIPHPIPAAPGHPRPPILAHNAPPVEKWEPSCEKPTRVVSWDVVERDGRLSLSRGKSDTAAGVVVAYVVMSVCYVIIIVVSAISMHPGDWVGWLAFTLGALVTLPVFGFLLWIMRVAATRIRMIVFDRGAQEVLIDGKWKGRFSDVTSVQLDRIDTTGRNARGELALRIAFSDGCTITIDYVDLAHMNELRPFAEYLARYLGHELVLTPLNAPYRYIDS